MPTLAFANSASELDPASSVIFWGTLILFFGILGRYLAKLVHQPGVLGELLMGILLGNICYFWGMPLMFILRDSPAIFSIIQKMLSGVPLPAAVQTVIPDPHYANQVLTALGGPNGHDWIRVTVVVDMFSRYGVIFLLFMVGLESSLEELKKTGRESFQVACIGVLAPIILGLVVLSLLMPKAQFSELLFVAATLSATSVGITARVMKDMKKLNTREAKTILGAAMIDDVLGLILLAIVSAMVLQHGINLLSISQTIASALLFFPAMLLLGPLILKRMIACADFLDLWEAKLLVSFVFLMCFSWLATLVHMSSIIGAFVAGIIIHDGFFESREREFKNSTSIKQLMAPLEAIFAPLFFILIGMQVRVETFLSWDVLLIAISLILVAIISKLVSGFGGSRRDDRLLIGIGMMPRGEVGLIFASVGKTLGVIPDTLFSGIVLMVIVTTVLTPIWMKTRYRQVM